MKFTSREIFGVFLVLIVGLLSLGAWQSFFVSAFSSGVGSIWKPLIWFSVLSAFFFVGAVVWSNVLLRILGSVLVFIPSLVFMHSWIHLGILSVAVLLACWSGHIIQNETVERLIFHFFRTVRTGQLALVFALSLGLSSGYFMFMRDASWEQLVPRFQFGDGATKLIFKSAAFFYPELKKAADQNVTVDEFLLSMRANQTEAAPAEPAKTAASFFSVPGVAEYMNENGFSGEVLSDEELAQKMFVLTGHEQMASLIGRPVMGDERIADIFSLAIQKKVTLFLKGGEAMKQAPPKAVPFLLTVLLFLTLLSLGSVLGPLWILAGLFVFSVSLMARWVKIVRLPREQETLEE